MADPTLPAHLYQQIPDEFGGFRKIFLRRKTVTEAKLNAFLQKFAETGIKSQAADYADLHVKMIDTLQVEDEAFAEAFEIAKAKYKEKVLAHHQNLLFNGTVKRNYDRNGDLISEETVYPIKLIEMELKKVDPEYRDRQEITHKNGGGVMIAPAEMSSVEDWETRFKNAKTIDGEATEVDEKEDE